MGLQIARRRYPWTNPFPKPLSWNGATAAPLECIHFGFNKQLQWIAMIKSENVERKVEAPTKQQRTHTHSSTHIQRGEHNKILYNNESRVRLSNSGSDSTVGVSKARMKFDSRKSSFLALLGKLPGNEIYCPPMRCTNFIKLQTNVHTHTQTHTL